MCFSRANVLGVSAAFFTVAALLHASRLLYGWTATLNGWTVPIWFSAVGVIIASTLAYELWKILGQSPKTSNRGSKIRSEPIGKKKK